MEDENEDLSVAIGGLRESLQELTDPSTTPEAQTYARRILADTAFRPGRGKEESEILSQMEKNAAAARATLRAAREKILSRRYNPAEGWLAAAAAFGSPTRTGAFGETVGNVAGSLIDPLRRKREFETERDREAFDLEQALGSIDDRELAARLGMLQSKQQREAKLAAEALKVLGKRSQSGTSPVDRAFAQDYVQFITGGAADMNKSLRELGGALLALESGRDDITGPVIGLIPRKIRDSIPGLQRAGDVQDIIEQTVQRSLRPILGAQFTKEEGERLIARVYNPQMDEQTNARRLRFLIEQLNRAYQGRIAAARYYEENGTLKGFKGKIGYTIDDLWPEGFDPEEEIEDTGIESETPDEEGIALEPGDEEVEEEGSPVEMIRLEDLPPLQKPRRRPWYRRVLGMAEGGPVEPGEDEESYVMDDGTVVVAPAGTPRAEVVARYARRAEPKPDFAETGGLDPAEILLGTGMTAGSAILGSLAGKYGVRLGEIAHDLVPGMRTTSPESRLIKLLEAENLPPSEVVSQVTRGRRRGVPLMPVDLAGDEMRALASGAMTEGNPETRPFLKILQERQSGSRGRVAEQVNRALKPDPFLEKEQELIETLQRESKPHYAEAYEKFPAVRSKTLMRILDTPSGKVAAKRAVKAIRDRPEATIGKKDALGMIQTPSLEFVDRVKQELDDMILKEEGSGINYQSTARGKRLRGLRDALREELDTITTDPKTGISPYKQARETWGDNLGVLDALRFGRNEFDKITADELAERVSRMSWAEKDALRTGVAHSILDSINRPTTDINAAQRVIGSPLNEEKLGALFDNPKEFEIFREALRLESDLFENSKEMVRSGQRAIRAEANPDLSVVQRVARRAPTLGIFSPTMWVLRFFREKPKISDAESAKILRMLRTNDQPGLRALEKNLGRKFGRVARRARRRGKAGLVGAALGAAAPWVIDTVTEDDEESGGALGLPGPDEPGIESESRATGSSGGPPRRYRPGGRRGFARGGLVRPPEEPGTGRSVLRALTGASGRLSRLAARYDGG